MVGLGRYQALFRLIDATHLRYHLIYIHTAVGPVLIYASSCSSSSPSSGTTVTFVIRRKSGVATRCCMAWWPVSLICRTARAFLKRLLPLLVEVEMTVKNREPDPPDGYAKASSRPWCINRARRLVEQQEAISLRSSLSRFFPSLSYSLSRFYPPLILTWRAWPWERTSSSTYARDLPEHVDTIFAQRSWITSVDRAPSSRDARTLRFYSRRGRWIRLKEAPFQKLNSHVRVCGSS